MLDPVERTAEILFGLIMALSFTGTIEVATAGRDDVTPVLYAALGCNLAWGLVDAVMYVVTNLVERSRRIADLRAFAHATDDAEAKRVLAWRFPPQLVDRLVVRDVAALREQAMQLLRGLRVRVSAADLRGALGVFLLVVLATFPVVVPYLVLQDAVLARRISNGISLVMLYACGHVLGRHAKANPLWLGLGMVAIGVVLVGTTIALGG